jgi:GH25 family lysozyme M1 (1,4-beta-N-acetylmuramidase)
VVVGRMRGLFTTVSVAVVAAGLLVGAPEAEGSTSATRPAHPDSDYMGSTIRAHEGTAPRALTSQASASAVTTGGAQGLDVSHWQGTVDWNAVAANGASFGYMKATEGTTYTDPQFGTNYAGSANAGLARGAYHFALPDSSSGAAQANFFLNSGGGWVADGHTMPPVLDIEYNPYGTSDWAGWCYGLTTTQMSAWISDFATTIHDRTNRWPVIYTTNGWWSNCTGNNAGSAATDPLWIAYVGSAAGTIPGGWAAYTLWQYANSGTFPGDQDVFNGSVDQLRAFATGDAPDLIVAHYNQLGSANSYLGNPSGGEYTIAGGWAQNYEHGVIYYTPATGAWAVFGQILNHYQQLGGPGGALGFPTTDETPTPDGVGRYNHFSKSASIYWTQSTGAWSVQGSIRDRWAALGWEGGPMGYPTTDETPTPDGVGRYNHFSKSASIYWTQSTGAWSVQGAIRDRWAALGWEHSRLGYPTSDEFGVPGGRRNNFQHGYITWYSASNTTQVTYY